MVNPQLPLPDPDSSPENQPPQPPAKKRKKAKFANKLRIRADLAHGGQLHVRHMSDGSEEIRTPCGTLCAADHEGTAPVWIQIAKRGAFRGHPSGPFALDDKVFDEIIRNFTATQNKRVPIDFEHASEADPTEGSIPTDGAPAQGWITQLEKRNDGLYGLVEWLPKAREYIRAGQYRYFSPAIRFNSRDRVTGAPIGARLTSGALTNHPFLDGMQKLAARDHGDEPLTASDLLDAVDALRDAVYALESADPEDGDGDEDEPDEAAVMADHESKDPIPMTEPAEKTISLKDHETQVSALTLQLKDAESKLAERDAELKTLRDAETARVAAEQTKRVETAFATYKDARKLSDADKSAMAIVLKSDPELFDKLYPAVSPGNAPLLKRLTRDGGDPPPADMVVPDIKTLTDKYLKAGKSIEEATSLAFTEARAAMGATH